MLLDPGYRVSRAIKSHKALSLSQYMVLFAGTGEAFTSKKTAYASQAEALFMTVSKIRFSDSLFVIDCFYLFYVKSSNITNNQ